MPQYQEVFASVFVLIGVYSLQEIIGNNSSSELRTADKSGTPGSALAIGNIIAYNPANNG